jgi:signal peptidase I
MRAVAILVSLLLWPGWGHYLLGRFVRGHIWAGAALLCLLLIPLHPALALAGMLVRIPAALDAALVEIRPTPSGTRWDLILGGVGALVGAFVLMRVYYIEGFKIPSGGQIPTLQIGDHLFINKLAYRLGAPERGDMIVFAHPCEPDKDFVERVVALGGDTVELRCDVLYVNSVAAPTRPSPGECHYWDFDMHDGWDRDECTQYTETIGEVEHSILSAPDRPERDRERSSAAPGDYPRVQGRHDFPADRAPSCDAAQSGADDRPAGHVEESAPESGKVAGACRPQRRYRVPDGHVFTLGDNRDNSSDSRAWGPVPVENIKGRLIGIWWSTDHENGIRWSRIGHVR